MLDGVLTDRRALDWALRYWPVFCVSFAGSLLGTFLFRRLALRFGIVDNPDALVKTHKEPVAYLGGLGILVGVVAGLLLGLQGLQAMGSAPRAETLLLGLMFGASAASLLGVTDDLVDLPPRIKLLGQVTAALAILSVGIGPDFGRIVAPLHRPPLDALAILVNFLVVILFVLSATNAVNLLDGLDGLCGGVTAIIGFGMLLLGLHCAAGTAGEDPAPFVVIVCLALIGAVLGFLPFNCHPARIFMGDAGSLLLGFVLATVMLLFAEQEGHWWLASIVVFGLPVLDTSVTLVRRWLNHRPLFLSDRGHLYDQMIDRGVPLRGAVAGCYLLAALYVCLGLAIGRLAGLFASILFLCVLFISGLIVTKQGLLRMKGHRGAAQSPMERDRCAKTAVETAHDSLT